LRNELIQMPRLANFFLLELAALGFAQFSGVRAL